MCLAVPGQIVEIKSTTDASGVGSVALVDFQGSRIEVNLAMTPQAQQGNWVLVHAGFALNVLNEEEAKETWEYLKMAGLDFDSGESDSA